MQNFMSWTGQGDDMQGRHSCTVAKSILPVRMHERLELPEDYMALKKGLVDHIPCWEFNRLWYMALILLLLLKAQDDTSTNHVF